MPAVTYLIEWSNMIHAYQRIAGPRLLTNATVVTPTEVIEGGTVVMAGGIITDVLNRTYAGDPGAIDLGGRMVMPGFVCLHNDAIEREINPRPGADLDSAFALLHLDRK